MNDQDHNAFGDLLAVLKEEELIRLRRRLQNADNRWWAGILQNELEERYALQVLSEARNEAASI